MRKKVCLISSSGGHFEQLLMLEKLSDEFDSFIVTEKTEYNSLENDFYYLHQVNRKEIRSYFYFLLNCLISIKIYFNEKPDIIISTGALAVIPMFIIGKIARKKLVFIESFSKSNSPTLTGKLIYKFADLFIVQWESMKEIYPDALFLGSIY